MAFIRESLASSPRATSRASSRSARTPSSSACRPSCAENDRIASTPVTTATDIGAALRLASALFPDDAQKRIVLLSDGNDTTGAARQRRRSPPTRGIRIETAASASAPPTRSSSSGSTTPVYRPPRRVGRGVAEIRSRVAQPATVRLFADGDAGQDEPVELTAGTEQGHVRRHPGGGRLPHVPRGRRGRTRHVQPERPGGLQHDREGRAADLVLAGDDESPPNSSRRSRKAPAGRHASSPRRSRPTSRAWRRTTASSSWTSRDSASTTASWRALQVYVRDLGKGLVMVGGPRSYGAGGYQKTSLEETLPGRHGRPRPREAARHRPRRRHRPVGLDGRLPLQHVRQRRRRRDRDRWRPEGRHRQGSDPSGRGGHDRARRTRRRGLQRVGALGRPDPATRQRRRPAGPDRRHPGRRPDQHLCRPRRGGEVTRRRDRHAPAHHPADRRLVDRPVSTTRSSPR